jgi:hypothetical protein
MIYVYIYTYVYIYIYIYIYIGYHCEDQWKYKNCRWNGIHVYVKMYTYISISVQIYIKYVNTYKDKYVFLFAFKLLCLYMFIGYYSED